MQNTNVKWFGSSRQLVVESPSVEIKWCKICAKKRLMDVLGLGKLRCGICGNDPQIEPVEPLTET